MKTLELRVLVNDRVVIDWHELEPYVRRGDDGHWHVFAVTDDWVVDGFYELASIVCERRIDGVVKTSAKGPGSIRSISPHQTVNGCWKTRIEIEGTRLNANRPTD